MARRRVEKCAPVLPIAEAVNVAPRTHATAGITITDWSQHGMNAHRDPEPTKNAIFHAACGQWWTGLSVHHCCDCHRNFTSVSAFDKHRDGSHARGTRHCVDLASIGLVDAGRKFPCWGWPGDNERWTDDEADVA